VDVWGFLASMVDLCFCAPDNRLLNYLDCANIF
jgi:hypothetical protein